MSAKEENVALVDIGSNSIRACVYSVDMRKGSFKKVIDARDFVGLGSYVDEAGVMSSQGIAAGGKAVTKMVRMAKTAGCTQIHAFATAAVRNCANSKDVAKLIGDAAGCDVRILSGKDEARLSMAGALQSTSIRSGLFFDLGGGSTELSGLSAGKLTEWDSLPMGSLSSWRSSGAGVIPGPVEIDAISQGFAELLKTSPVHVSKYSNVCAVGGSARLALKAARTFGRVPESSNVLSLADLEHVLDAAKISPDSLARTVLRIKPARVHTFVPGCAIMYALLRESGCASMEVAKTGIREGYLMAEVVRDKSVAGLCKSSSKKS